MTIGGQGWDQKCHASYAIAAKLKWHSLLQNQRTDMGVKEFSSDQSDAKR